MFMCKPLTYFLLYVLSYDFLSIKTIPFDRLPQGNQSKVGVTIWKAAIDESFKYATTV